MATEHSVFTKKHDEVMANDKKAILEEMNLPPTVVSFIRKNEKTLKITLVLFVVAVVAWEVYGDYQHRQREKASSLLYSAVQSSDDTQKDTLLRQLVDNYSGSKSAVWGELELGHLAFQNKDYQGAIDKYTAIVNQLSKDDSLYPLVQFSLAQAYDSIGESGLSEKAYKILLDFGGFAGEGYKGLGRLYESQGKIKQAIEMYESYISLPSVKESPSKNMVEYKLGVLKGK